MYFLSKCIRNLFVNHLPIDQILIDTTQCNQVLVLASLLDQPMLHDDDLVSVSDSGQSVSHDNRGLFAGLDQLI
jgi:hypothetical protein